MPARTNAAGGKTSHTPTNIIAPPASCAASGPKNAVIVLDVATDASGRAAYLLAQSYMPAQDIHVLRVPGKPNEQAWYTTAPGERLVTPEWTFGPNERRRFREF